MKSLAKIGAVAIPLCLALAAAAQAQVLSGPPGAVAAGGSEWQPLSATAGRVLALTDFAGVKCDGASDDTAAVQTGLNGLAASTRVRVPAGRACYFAASVTIPSGVTLDLGNRVVGNPGGMSFNAGLGGAIYLANTATITLGAGSSNAPAARIENGYIVNKNLPALPASQAAALTAIAAYAGTAITVPSGSGDWYADNLMIVGFATCIQDNSATGRGRVDEIKGDCTSGLLATTAADVDFGQNIEFGNFFAQGMPDDEVHATTSATTASGNAVLHFASVPSTVNVGAYVLDLACFGACLPQGVTVSSKTSTTVTLSANATGSGVGGSDPIVFGGDLAERRTGTCIQVGDSNATLVNPTCVGFDVGLDFYNASGVLYQTHVLSGHIDSYYYYQTSGVVTKGVRLRGSVDGARFDSLNIVNQGIGISCETGGSLNRSSWFGTLTENNQRDLVSAGGPCAGTFDGGILHVWTAQNGAFAPVTLSTGSGSWRFVADDFVGTQSTIFSVASGVNFFALGNTFNEGALTDYLGNSNSGQVAVGPVAPDQLLTVGNGNNPTLDIKNTSTSEVAALSAYSNFTNLQGVGGVGLGAGGTVNNVAFGNTSGNFGVKTLAAATGNTLCYNTGPIAGFNALATCSSLRALKAEIRPLSLGLADLMKLRPKQYWSKTGRRQEIGLIAEDVQAAVPLLSTYYDGKLDGVDYMHLTALLVKGLQQQQAEIEALKRRLR